MNEMLHRDALERVLRARHRQTCGHEVTNRSGGICARCDVDALLDSPEFAAYLAAKVAEA